VKERRSSGLEKDEVRAPELTLRGRRRMGEGEEREERTERRGAIAVYVKRRRR